MNINTSILIICYIFFSQFAFSKSLLNTTSYNEIKKEKEKLKKIGEEFEILETTKMMNVYFLINSRGEEVFRTLDLGKAEKLKISDQEIEIRNLPIKIFSLREINISTEKAKFQINKNELNTRNSIETSTNRSWQNVRLEIDAVITSDQNTIFLKPEFVVKSYSDRFNETRLLAKELYFQYQKSNTSISIGNQIRVFGVFDEMSELDILSNKMNDRLYFDTGPELRNSKSLVFLQQSLKDSRVDMFLTIPSSLRSFPEQINASDNFGNVDAKNGIIRNKRIKKELVPVVQNAKYNFRQNNDLEFGIRYQFDSSLADVQFLVAKYVDPISSVTASERLVSDITTNKVGPESLESGFVLEYRSREVIAVGLSSQFKSFLGKFEVSYKTNYGRTMLKKNVWTLVGGGEKYFDKNDISLRGQVIHSILTNKEEDDRDTSVAIFEIAQNYSEQFEYKLRSTYVFSDKSFMISPQICYNYSDDFSFNFSYFMFAGRNGSYFGIDNGKRVLELSLKGNF